MACNASMMKVSNILKKTIGPYMLLKKLSDFASNLINGGLSFTNSATIFTTKFPNKRAKFSC
jgi:hypothetical protein